jgi:uncharacterized repeat protein (TIGR01451 family)
MNKAYWRTLRSGARLSTLAFAALLAAILAGTAFAVSGATPIIGDGDTPWMTSGARAPQLDEEAEEELLALDFAYESRRTAGSTQLNGQRAGEERHNAEQSAQKIRGGGRPSGTVTFGGAWGQIGPNPIVQGLRSPGATQRYGAMSGRIGALAIRPSNGQFILGAAQGGIWLFDAATQQWSPKSDNAPSLAIGALAVAPSNDAIVYAGTGEGSLAGDSYYGNGVLKSTDGGNTWKHVSGDYFQGVATSRIVVDPVNPKHLYAAILRGRGGARRVSPSLHSRYGVWESKDGAESWNLIQGVADNNGATDLEIDPRNPQILYSSFWGDAIYKSVNGGRSWAKVMKGLPVADYAGEQTRFSIALSHPASSSKAVLYVGFDWLDTSVSPAVYHKSRVWKSIDEAANWSLLPAGAAGSVNNVEDYCGQQCFYDNVIEADPKNPDVVFAAGQFNYAAGSGGIYRSDDGGQTWKDMGYDQHPDFHALAFNPANPEQVLIGSDGGVWYSAHRGGRNNPGSIRADADWQNLNGTVGPTDTVVSGRTGLAITQFTSIATVPQVAPGRDGPRFWGGTQDNGTIRKSVNSKTWFDVASGDGGQVLVDPTAEECTFGPSCFVYGTYYGISPYRYTDGGNFFTNSPIYTGLNRDDRSDFYIPFTMNRDNPNKLFLGTYRLYRTDNARTESASDVLWKPISPDLTSGCPGIAPNGARNCTVSAIGVGGGSGVYTGSLDGYVYVSPDAQLSDTPTWTRVGHSGEADHQGENNGNNNGGDASLPLRPVASIAVDRSNWRTAYLAYAGFDAGTPGRTGHVFTTKDGGKSWKNITGNLPDSPANSVLLDPSFPDTLYVGTDVGPFVTYNGGRSWYPLGTGFPMVSIWQLDLDPSHRLLAAGTHGRGAFTLSDTVTAPALVLGITDSGKPVGPNSTLEYTLTVKNIGNAPATGVTVSVPVPDRTRFLSADNGGSLNDGRVRWSVPAIAPGGSVALHLNVKIDSNFTSGDVVLDGAKVSAAGGFETSGSPFKTAIAPAFKMALTPASQLDGGRVGTSVPYKLKLQNLGYTADRYNLTASSSYTTTFFDASCTTPLTATPTIAGGDSITVCAKVAVPSTAANDARNTGTVTATSVGSPTLSAGATLTTIAVAVDTLLVDNDDNAPDVQGYYNAALSANGAAHSTWDLKVDKVLPLNYTKSFKNIVWFTGNSYPGPVTPYESVLKAALDNGTRLFMAGQDLLDQAAGSTPFVRDYLHVTWNDAVQNDKPTAYVTGVTGNPVTGTFGKTPINHSVLGAAFEDRITPNTGAIPAFTDDTGETDALTYSGTYKVVFLAFGLESFGTAADQASLMGKTMTFFGP